MGLLQRTDESRGSAGGPSNGEGPSARPGVLQVFCLGQFRIVRAGETAPISTDYGRAGWLAFKYLLANWGRQVPTSDVVRLVTSGATDGAALCDPMGHTRGEVAAVNDILRSPDLSGSAPVTYIAWSDDYCSLLSDGSIWLDAAEFETECEEARGLAGTDLETAARLFERALSLYRGDFLPDHSGDTWAKARREHYRQILLETGGLVARKFQFSQDYVQARRVLKRMGQITVLPQGLEDLFRYLEDLVSEESGALCRALEPPLEPRGALLCNRATFFKLLTLERRRIARGGGEASVVVFEVTLPGALANHLREAGDGAQRVAGSLLRASDVLCRLDESHFAVLLTGTGPDAARAAVGRIRLACQKDFSTMDAVITARVGPA
ncbi:MAG: hypothetical protein NUW23_11070 [Firmicutes bacterium]|jgi:hypothetical protein|nr:hypothetical protein [Bacillota bacterium]